MCRQSASRCLIKSPSRQHRALPGLPQRLATLTDPRHRRGKRHPFVSVLLIGCSAVLAGARSFAAVGQWSKNAPQDALARLGARTTSVFAVRVAPSPATIRRIINHTCPGELADLLGADPAGSDALAMEGKSESTVCQILDQGDPELAIGNLSIPSPPGRVGAYV
jgi:hypothetical protein